MPFAILSDTWLSSTGDANYNNNYNLSGDNKIDIADMILLSEKWLTATVH